MCYSSCSLAISISLSFQHQFLPPNYKYNHADASREANTTGLDYIIVDMASNSINISVRKQ